MNNHKRSGPSGWLLLVVVVFLIQGQGIAFAGVEEDLNALRNDMAEMKKDIEMIQLILQRIVGGGAQGSATVSISGRPTLGEHDAPVTIVEFSDYQCPYCKRFVTTVFPTLKRDYIDTGKVRYVFRDFPLASHLQAPKAHEAAHCAGEYHLYWQMHDRLFQNQNDLSVPALIGYAEEIGLDADGFEACLKSGKYQADVQNDLTAGANANVRGTPTFVIGKSSSDGTITGTVVRGVKPLAKFLNVIESVQMVPPAKTEKSNSVKK